MKNIKTTCTLAICVALMRLMASALLAVEGVAQTQGERISLSIATGRDSYVPGEVIELEFLISNHSEAALTIDAVSVERGNLRVFISEDGETFREYIGPRWALNSTPFRPTLELRAGAAYKATATLLFNHRLETEHLSELYAQQIRTERIDTAYALPRSGRYFLKAVLKDARTGSTIESSPVAVMISEPVGDDSLVWERLKENPEYAYFMHRGHFRGGPAKAEPLIRALNELVESYPDSIYARRIGAYLEQLGVVRE